MKKNVQQINKNISSKKAFTLVEMLISIAVFMSVMVVAMTALVTVINTNKQTQEIKSVVDNVTFAIDSIARNARVGINYSCMPAVTSGQPSFAGDCPNNPGNGLNAFSFVNINGPYQYRFVPSASLSLGQGNIQMCTKSTCNESINSADWQSITAPTSTVNITNMTFYVLGTASSTDPIIANRTQPRVIITIEGDVMSKEGKRSFMLQTSASERSRLSTN